MEQGDIFLSVIVPIYNAKKTLARCLDSILQQTNIELEIICVDDESTDESLKICKEFEQEDSRVKVISKRNGGVASARNRGLEIARGKYVTFVDQDDWVEKNAYEVMLGKAFKEDADMVVCNYTKDYGNSVEKILNRSLIPSNINETNDLIRYAFFREEYRGFAAFVWNKIIKRSFLEKNNVSFDGSLRRGDDVLFFSTVASYNPKTVYLDENFYHYVQREDSVTHTLTKENIDRLEEILIGYERSIALLSKADISAEALGYMKCFYVYHASRLFELADEHDLPNEKERYRNAIRLYLQEYKKQNVGNEERIIRINKLLEI